MKKGSVLGIGIAAVIYLLLFVLASSCGLIHPACYAYAGTVVPLLFSFVFLYVCANMQCFGAAAILNGTVLIVAVLMGEGDAPLFIGMIVFAALAAADGGALGNLYDRISTGAVTDYIELSFVRFPVFNFADICITCGLLVAAGFLLVIREPAEEKGADV